MSVFVGSKYEHQSLSNLAPRLVDEGEKYGIPVLAVTAVGKEMVRDAKVPEFGMQSGGRIGSLILLRHITATTLEVLLQVVLFLLLLRVERS